VLSAPRIRIIKRPEWELRGIAAFDQVIMRPAKAVEDFCGGTLLGGGVKRRHKRPRDVLGHVKHSCHASLDAFLGVARHSVA
jgi:hypothetical protein